MDIKWLGHSCFVLTSNSGVRLLMDPCDPQVGYSLEPVEVDGVTCSHDHYDHNASRTINGNFKSALARNGRFEFRGIPFYGLSTYHDDVNGAKRGMNTMYRFTAEGITLCHCGDLGAIPNHKVLNAIREVDFLFLPIGGVYTMELPEVRRFIEEVNPRIIVPMHYRVGGLTLPVADIDGFLDMIPPEFVEYVGNSVDITKDELPDRKECWVFDRS